MNAPEPLPVAEDWFAIEAADENGVRRVRETHVHEYGGGSMWLVEGTERALLVETGLGVAPLRAFVETITDKPVIAFASLGYYDHAGGLHQFDERWIHGADAHRIERPNRINTAAQWYLDGAFAALPHAGFDPASYVMPASKPTRLLNDGDVIDLGNRRFRVCHLPGVTSGASALFEEETGVLFTGETLVWDGDFVYDGEPPERSDDADRQAFRTSMRRLLDLPAT
ncbi:MAG: MBL fold metallo-hydrolase, partial [Rhodospirillaceae bacterium]|nr:MBL fold metallo-hydrolase [Rhodospirillaceae bacterium]MBT7611689.1 MBL fold metallo-hydrolase [Rhodospirillaceae bacterium]